MSYKDWNAEISGSKIPHRPSGMSPLGKVVQFILIAIIAACVVIMFAGL